MYSPPKFSEVIAQLSPVKLPWQGQYWSIGDWGKHRIEIVQTNRSKKGEMEIFNTFVSGLLHTRADTGKYKPRIDLMNVCFSSLSDVTEEKARDILERNRYYGIDKGVKVILEARELVLKSREDFDSFPWELYFQDAENKAESSFDEDQFLGIKGVGHKGRDFALGQFSLRYCAIDRHISEFLARTGLLLYGYGDPNIGTNPGDDGNYMFMQRLVMKFAKESGWAPSMVDASIWFFGQGICKGKPECSNCPITSLCLTFTNKGVNVQNL